MKTIGLDPALGGGCALSACAHGDKLEVLDARVETGLNRTEEIFEMLEVMVNDIHPSLVIVEFDSQQKGIGNDDRLKKMADRHRFRVQPHYTRGMKMDQVFGVARMDQSFRAGEIRIPYGDQYTKDRMEPLLHQLRAWRPDVPTKNLVQDLVMTLWFQWLVWHKAKESHRDEHVAPAWRPGWASSMGGNGVRGLIPA